jgi:membrane protease YdiL (CAAX protease family)
MCRLLRNPRTIICDPVHTTGPYIADSWANIAAMVGGLIFLAPSLARMVTLNLVPSAGGLQQGVALLAQQVSIAALALWHLRVNVRWRWNDFGLGWPILLRDAKVGLAVGVALVAVNATGVWLGRGFASLLFGPTRALAMYHKEQAVLMGLFQYEQSVLALIILFAAVAFAAPIAEELFFRGYLYAALKGKVGRHAIWLSSLLFTALHSYLIQGPAVFLLALCLTLFYEKRGSLWGNVVAHASLNTVVAVFLLMQRS